MNKTTCTLAFLVTLLVTTSASAVVVTTKFGSRPVKRAQLPAEEKATTRNVKRPERKCLPAKPAEEAAPAVVSTADTQAPEPIALSKPNATVTHEVVGAIAEPVTEEFTEYDDDGRLRAIWRGYTPAYEQGSLKLTHVISESSTKDSRREVQIEIDGASLTNAVDYASNQLKSDNVRWTSGNGYEGNLIHETKLNSDISSLKLVDESLCNLRIGLIVLTPATVKHGRFESWHANGQLESRGDYVRGALQGDWTWYFDNGQVRETGAFKAGHHSGSLKSFYPNGQRKAEGFWVEGIAHGNWSEWFENGAMSMTGEMLNGQRHGYWYFWTQDSAKLREGRYENGIEVGEWTNWQPPEEKLQQIITELDMADEAQELLLKHVVHTLSQTK